LYANSRAVASPMPEEAPVTITTLSLNKFFTLHTVKKPIQITKLGNLTLMRNYESGFSIK